MRWTPLLAALLCAVSLAGGGCGKGKKGVEPAAGEIPEEEQAGESADRPDSSGTGEQLVIGPADPPYGPEVTFPSGLHLGGLVEDPELTGTYPDPGSGRFPFGGSRRRHYEPVGYFIDIPALSSTDRQKLVSENFKLSEYVRLPERNQDPHAYIDAQIAFHAQELRYAWGGPLILTSTYRSPRYNYAIGGAAYSRHMYGDAVDIRATSTSMAQDLYNLAKFLEVSYLEPADLTIVGRSTPWIHIDDRGWPVNTPDTR